MGQVVTMLCFSSSKGLHTYIFFRSADFFGFKQQIRTKLFVKHVPQTKFLVSIYMLVIISEHNKH